MNSYPVIILTLILAAIPVTAIVSLAYAFYDWLVSRLPKNIQAVMIAHEAQVRRIIGTVVDAVEQEMKGSDGGMKKAEAIDKAREIFASLPLPKSIPQPSDALINALIEEAVAYLPKSKPPYAEPVKAANDSNSFTEATTIPLPVVNGVAPPSPLDPVSVLDAL